MKSAALLPRWSLSAYFSSLESPEFTEAFRRYSGSLQDLARQFDRDGVAPGPDLSFEAGQADKLSSALDGLNGVLSQSRLLRSYVHAHVAVDSRDAVALARQSELAAPSKDQANIFSRFTAWVGRQPLDSIFDERPGLRTHEFPLRTIKTQAARLLSAPEETLLAEVYDTSTGAWARLHSNFTSQIQVPLGSETLPMSAVRTMAYDPDPEVRREAYHAELDAWKANELTMAASINSIKGQTSMIAKRRGWGSLLDEALFDARIDRESLDAMMSASKDAFPVFRRYLRAKAKALGHSGGLPWYDIFAPVGQDAEWSYEKAEGFVEGKFETFSARMSGLARRAFDKQWVDAEPRSGKVDGAFCTGTRPGESRVLMNFKPAFGSVSTLAHELGHAYHNLCLQDRTELQKATPMTLAETASIFCETIVKQAAIRESSGAERLGILEASIQGSCQTVVDITSRFLFESEVVEKRASREMSPAELCDAMTRAQKETYGDGLDNDLMHPYMWAVKPHYYSQRPFYNFPYMFGLLFSLGLYAVFHKEPEGFQERYDRLLSETGLDTADNLAARFGIDIRSKAFWAGSLAIVEQDVDAFVSMVG